MSQLHIPSLLLANVSVVFFCAALMLYSWWCGRHERTLLWASVMLFLEGAGLILNALRGLGFDWVPIVVGNVVLLLCIGMTWAAMRTFCGREPRWWLVTLGAWGWLLLCLWPAFYGDIRWRVTAFTLLLVAYMLAAMHELWRARGQQVSILAAQLLMGGHVLFHILRMLFGTWGNNGSAPYSPMFVALLIESVLYAVGMAFLVLSMVKERAEQQYRVAAYSDPLTGIGNRRAFLSAGEHLLRLCAEQRQPVALLLCDLDHFKAINDRLGHAEGDRVLQAFSAGVVDRLRKTDVFGRIGGEEFACLVAGSQAEALALAERIRSEFAEASGSCAQSVSIGVASSTVGGYDLPRLLSLADQALYAVKRSGRNQVQAFGADGEPLAAYSR